MPLVSDADVAAVTLNDTDGSRIYRRSLTLVLVTAAAELFPDAAVFVEHSAPTLGAYYCRVRGRDPFSAADLEAIATRMRAIVDADVPIHKTKVPVAQAVAIFEARGEIGQGAPAGASPAGQPGALRAVRTAGLLPGLHAAVHRPPAPLRPASAGRRASCCSIRTRPSPASWRASRPIRSCSRPSRRPARGSTRWASAAPARSTTRSRRDGCRKCRWSPRRCTRRTSAASPPTSSRVAMPIRVVLVAGPSSSGKTTFSKRLAVQLLASGRRPVPGGARRLLPRPRPHAV